MRDRPRVNSVTDATRGALKEAFRSMRASWEAISFSLSNALVDYYNAQSQTKPGPELGPPSKEHREELLLTLELT